ncbi:MAG: envelope stress response membrane protein PspB [Gammaproteobacteria bacterium]|nr:envelope stress response membrane protein PspB [Gammaproteobacteria bacterium]
MEVTELIFVPIVLFLIFVAPLWLFLHYRERQRLRELAAPKGSGAAGADLTALAQRMERRIEALESLLDAETPGWRNHGD